MKELSRLYDLPDGEHGLVLLASEIQPGVVIQTQFGDFQVMSCSVRRAEEMTGTYVKRPVKTP